VIPRTSISTSLILNKEMSLFFRTRLMFPVKLPFCQLSSDLLVNTQGQLKQIVSRASSPGQRGTTIFL
jgi:hypothetical protein